MSKTTKLLAGTAVLALAAAGQAHAVGTAAGTDVDNTFALTYKAGNSNDTITLQNPNTVSFKVDRVVNLAVVASTPSVTGTAGQTNVSQVWTVTNTGNAPQAYDLDISQAIGTSSNDEFDTTSITVTYDVDADGDGNFTGTGDSTGNTYTLNTGTDTPTLDIPANGVIRVTTVSTIPGATNAPGNGDAAAVILVADTLEPVTGGFGTAGAQVTASQPTGAGLNTVETVLADGQGNNSVTVGGVTTTYVFGAADDDAGNDGANSAVSRVVVQEANVAALKDVKVIYEDIGDVSSAGYGCDDVGTAPTLAPGATATRYVPGACVEYTITVSNTGAAVANFIEVADALQEDLIFHAATAGGFSNTVVGGNTSTVTFNPALPSANTPCTAASNPCQVTLTNGSLAAGTTASPTTGTLTIRAEIK